MQSYRSIFRIQMRKSGPNYCSYDTANMIRVRHKNNIFGLRREYQYPALQNLQVVLIISVCTSFKFTRNHERSLTTKRKCTRCVYLITGRDWYLQSRLPTSLYYKIKSKEWLNIYDFCFNIFLFDHWFRWYISRKNESTCKPPPPGFFI